MIWFLLFAMLLFVLVLWYCMAQAFKPIDLKVQCPVCHGICGVMLETEDMEHPDWYDCDFCDATGFTTLQKAAEYAAGR